MAQETISSRYGMKLMVIIMLQMEHSKADEGSAFDVTKKKLAIDNPYIVRFPQLQFSQVKK